MSFTDEGVKTKLSALNETQESIVTVAQWIMFHRRHADRSAAVWLQKLKDSSASKRLNLVYLANEVVQQSKARKKDDFLIAFSPIIADATATAYKGATNEVQNKLKRVVEVWRSRDIFEPSIQEAVESRIAEIDKNRSLGKKALLGGSLFSNSAPSGSVPPQLQPLVAPQTALSKALDAAAVSAPQAETDYARNMSADAPLPAPPLHAARLSALLKTLASAEGAVSESIKARRDLVAALEKLLEVNRGALANDEGRLAELARKRGEAEAKRRDVEDAIQRKLQSADGADGGDAERPSSAAAGAGAGAAPEVNGSRDAGAEHPARRSSFRQGSPGAMQTVSDDDDGDDGEGLRPRVEALTPPPVEALTPPSAAEGAGAGSSVWSTTVPTARAFETEGGGGGGGPSAKKRKLGEGEFAGGDAMADLDEDVAELLRAEGGGR